MALVAEQGNNRVAAILILVILAILVYLLCFHWFILRHIEYNDEISGLSDQLGRFQRVAAQRSDYQTLLQSLQERKTDENLFLSGNDFNEAAAGMSERLSQMITVQADDSCQIVSRQPVRPRVEERFQKVTVNVRMRCRIEDLKKVLYSLETGVPMIIADEVTVIKPRSRRRRPSNRGPDTSGILDIRFNMSGYLRESA
jgi:general secretion pathway protein M